MNCFDAIKQLTKEMNEIEKEKDILEFKNKILKQKIIKLVKKIKHLEK